MMCPKCGVVIPDDADFQRRWWNHQTMQHNVDPLALAAGALADANVRYAREFARLKLANPAMTDKAAMFAATEATNDEVTRLTAELEIARRNI